MPRRAAYPIIQPGVLSIRDAAALNEALRDLQRLVGGFSVAAPLTLQEDSGGVRLGINQNGLLTIDHNGNVVGSEPILNFIDSGTVTFAVTNNAGATRIDVTPTASASGTTIKVDKDGTLVATRPELNFQTGDGLTLSVFDNGGSNRADIKEDIGGPIHTNRTLTPDGGVTLTFSGADTSALNRFINATHQIATQEDLNISREPDLGAGAGGRIDNYAPSNVDPVYYFGSNMQNNTLSGWLKPANFPDGATIWIVLTGPSDSTTLTLAHQNANSSAANRFFTYSQADIVLARYQWALLQYDNTAGYWRVLSVTPAAGGDATHTIYQVVVGAGIGNPDVSYANLTNDGTTVTVGKRTLWTDNSFSLSSGDNNNVNVGDVTLVNVDNGASGPNLNGITNGADGRTLFLWNAYGLDSTLTLKHQAAGSSAANRLYLPGGRDFKLHGQQGAVLFYNNQAPIGGAWCLLAATPNPLVGGQITNSDWTINTNTFTDVPGFSFQVGASEQWVAEFQLWVGGTTGGIQFQIVYTGGVGCNSIRAFTLGNSTSGTALAADSQFAIITFGPGASQAYVTYAAGGIVTIRVGVYNANSVGLIKLQAASATNGQTNTVYQGSYFTAAPVAF